VTGTPLVLSLSNGQSITIAVGQTTGSGVVCGARDDAYVQGSSALPAGVDHGQLGWELRERGDEGTVLNSGDR
jgi:hypothetical protein